jgi:hypothetical protein
MASRMSHPVPEPAIIILTFLAKRMPGVSGPSSTAALLPGWAGSSKRGFFGAGTGKGWDPCRGWPEGGQRGGEHRECSSLPRCRLGGRLSVMMWW